MAMLPSVSSYFSVCMEIFVGGPLFFFFSSRRRHTRCSRDWSSDVCSSDLDPVYKDALGDPLLRLTLDWRDNERKMVGFATPIAVDLARAMGARQINPFPGLRDRKSVV